MSALVEQWPEHDRKPGRDGSQPRPQSDRHLRPVERAAEIDAPASDPATSWNVLTEELVSYPTRAQRIWQDRGSTSAVASPSRAYADAWLDSELERLRERRRQALRRSESSSTSLERHYEPLTDDTSLRLGDPGTAGRVDRHFPKQDRVRTARTAKAQATLRTPKRAAEIGPRGLRRLLPGAATLAVLAVAWFGVGALASSAHSVRVDRLPGTVAVPGGYAYVAKPGDTLWSIASRVEPGANPEPLVARLESEIGGKALQPGDRLVLPR